MKIIKPQPKQMEFLQCPADICVYGGAAGGGKSFALLMDALHFVNNSKAGYTIFRRNNTDIGGTGGLWETAKEMYNPLGIQSKEKPYYTITFKSGYNVKFAHLQYDDTVFRYQGLQLPIIGYDELTHFSKKQFFYMLSRNRVNSVDAGVKPYIRATCNPDPDSWVRDLLDWYIDKESGYAIPERSGVLRYFVVIDDEMIWGDTPDEVMQKSFCEPSDITSFSFIPSSLDDNQALLTVDSKYEAKLKAMSRVDYERLRKGNWNIKEGGGKIFRDEYFHYRNGILADDIVAVCRAWDLAATEKTKQNKSPDATASCLMGRLIDGRFVILDVSNDCLSAKNVRSLICDKAEQDYSMYGEKYSIFLPQDPGQAGKAQAEAYVRMLSGYNVTTHTVNGSKVSRAQPLAIQMENNNVIILGDKPWNKQYQRQMVAFPDSDHDDMVDASSDAFNTLSNKENQNQLAILLANM